MCIRDRQGTVQVFNDAALRTGTCPLVNAQGLYQAFRDATDRHGHSPIHERVSLDDVEGRQEITGARESTFYYIAAGIGSGIPSATKVRCHTDVPCL